MLWEMDEPLPVFQTFNSRAWVVYASDLLKARKIGSACVALVYNEVAFAPGARMTA